MLSRLFDRYADADRPGRLLVEVSIFRSDADSASSSRSDSGGWAGNAELCADASVRPGSATCLLLTSGLPCAHAGRRQQRLWW